MREIPLASKRVIAHAVLDAAIELRRTADRCEVLLLVRACEWADLHPMNA